MIRLLVVVAVLAVLPGCALLSSTLAPVEKTFAEALISDQQEAQLGLQLHEELSNGKDKVKFLSDAKVTGYVEGLVGRLTATANKERQLDWKVFVIDDEKTVNAFAAPGGRIYVYTGLLLAAKNEAQVVGVLGHELGHVVARHSARKLVYVYGIDAVTGMALGSNPNQVAEIATALVSGGTMLAYGREMENEADEFGARYAHYADYDPNQLAVFFEQLTAQSGDTTGLAVYLSSHPSNAERIDHIHAFIKNGGFHGSQVAPERIAAVQDHIRRLGNAAAQHAAQPAAQAPVAPPTQPAPAKTQPQPQPAPQNPTVNRSAKPGTK